ncbi:ABC transporter ATP-binding protein [Brucepastera parasyntrophica]|uniref:ABC transporter ATP-binding protein n=1 Tax=Brucepastera parasyntrophica TaxID=2880008 RepID=UPI00210AE156|nr:ABC transporter ATP-binding protein [Brucepastera parasyntrophica]ULQ61207.1 ABC transporter ATP-binding protein [Brucepastera parasyntrophica]
MHKMNQEAGRAARVSDTLLKADDISIVFGGLRAVSNFSSELKHGELVGLIGPNGAGKTTVFNMLSGIYKPTEGVISFTDRHGKENFIQGKKPHYLSKTGIARTFQNIRLFGNLTVEENVLIAMHNQYSANPLEVVFRTPHFYRSEGELHDRAGSFLELFHIESKSSELAKNLPYGEQRKLEIARALATNPLLLLLDEPAAGMNPQETQELMEHIKFIRKKFNLTILLIEHDMKLVMGVCERLIVLDYGRIIAAGLPHEIQKNPAVIKAYLGEEALIDA